jgi:hypothetical protein
LGGESFIAMIMSSEYYIRTSLIKVSPGGGIGSMATGDS